MEYKVIKEGNKEKWFDQNNKLVKEIRYYDNGQKEYEAYFLNDQFHKEDGPAVQYWYENGQKYIEVYYLNDQYHREDGPAFQEWFENGRKKYEAYCLNNQKVFKDQVIKEPNKTITIKGKEFSEDTVYKALKNYMNF